MNTYLFTTQTTMKAYNHKKWWIDGGVIRQIEIEADNLNAALKEYQKIVRDKYYIDISNTALKRKSPMYRDYKNGETKQVGYVLTGSTEFETDNYSGVWVKQFIDLWVEIQTITETIF